MVKHVLTVTLNPAIDVTMTVSGLCSGQEITCIDRVVSAGGKGVNVARALHLLGMPVFATGIVAGQTGDLMKRFLTKERIAHQFLTIKGLTRINWTMIDPHGNHQIRVLGSGPIVSQKEVQCFKSAYRGWLHQCSMVIFSGRNARGASDELYAHLVRLARKNNIPVVLDTAGQALSLALKEGPFMVKLNIDEAAGVYGRRIESLAQVIKAIEKFHGFGVEVVILSMGKRGAVGSDGKGIWHVNLERVDRPPFHGSKPQRVLSVNDVGCGDALLAGFVHAYRRGDCFTDALLWSVAAGTANAMNLTPGLIRRVDIEKSFKVLSIRKLR